MYIIEGRRKEAKGSINIGKCQDSRRRPIYTTIILRFIPKASKTHKTYIILAI